MNWLDVTLLIINIILFIVLIISIVIFAKKEEYFLISATIISFLFMTFFTFFCPFFVLDKVSGTTVGTITSIDKNFFGTTALYIRTTNNVEEKYCIEFDKKLEFKANELIGKDVKITYGKRIGIYSTGKCRQGPIETIESIESKLNYE